MQQNQLILGIHSFETQQISEFHDLKTTATQKQVTTNMTGTQ